MIFYIIYQRYVANESRKCPTGRLLPLDVADQVLVQVALMQVKRLGKPPGASISNKCKDAGRDLALNIRRIVSGHAYGLPQ